MLEGLQNEQQQKSKNAAQRGPQGNTFKPGPGLWLFERVYHRSPRWDKPEEVQPHVKRVFTKGNSKDQNREAPIIEKINTAWDTSAAKRSPALNFEEGRKEVALCTNPFCEKRTQVIGQPNVFDLKRLDKKHGYDKPVCRSCGLELSIQMIREIENKWIYVITGTGASAKLKFEIYAEKPGSWFWLTDPETGPRAHRDFDKRATSSSNTTRIPAEMADDCLQFFLSPVQLTENALQRLMQSARQNRSEMQDHDEQRRFTTVRRYFTNLALENKEIVSIIDPFSYAQEANHWDYEPVCDAWFTFNMNEQENTKKQIAVLLNAVAGEDDEHDIVDEMDNNKGRWQTADASKHKAAAWLKRYDACRDLLKNAQNDAAQRVTDWLDCDAHAIVEIGCQQEPDKPGFKYPGKSTLSLAMLHFAHVLEHMLTCPAGAAYVTRLAARQKRLVHRFVLHPNDADKEQLKLVREDAGDVAVSLLALFVPKIIHEAPLYQEADRMVKHLGNHAIQVTASKTLEKRTPFGHSEVIAVGDQAMALNDAMFAAYKKRFLPASLGDNMGWKLRTQLGDILKAYEVLTAFKTFSQDGDYEGGWEGFKADKKKADVAYNAANFMVSQTKLGFAWYLKVSEGLDMEDIEKTVLGKTNWREIIQSGSFKRYEKLLGYYHKIYKVGKILGGPVAFLMSGFDYLLNPPDILAAWERNRGEGVATALTYYGTGLSAAAALLQTLGMLSALSPGMAAAASAMVNPVLFLALVITVVGAIIFWATRKNELEKFAAHCLFGDEYGDGEHEPRPWATKPYMYWDDGRRRYQEQLIYLLNLVAGFKVQIISAFNGHVYIKGANKQRHTIGQLLYGGYVLPSFVPQGAKADCFVEGYYKTKDGRKPIRTRVVVDLESGNYAALDNNYRKVRVEAIPSNSWGTERFRGLSVQVDHKLPADYEEPRRHHYKFGARLDLSGMQNYLPSGHENYVEMANNTWGSSRSSLDVQPKPYYEKKKKSKKKATDEKKPTAAVAL